MNIADNKKHMKWFHCQQIDLLYIVNIAGHSVVIGLPWRKWLLVGITINRYFPLLLGFLFLLHMFIPAAALVAFAFILLTLELIPDLVLVWHFFELGAPKPYCEKSARN